MIQSIQDYENWRDRQYDLPEPDSTTPDEHATYAYSHDYPDDTKLEYVRDGEHAELRLSFTSEDPDTGVEEMLLGSDNVESLPELASDLRADISSYLDAQDTSSFFEQQGIPQAPGDRAAQWDDFTRTALYAFEAILKDVERGMDTQLTWKPIESDKRDWLYYEYCLRCTPRRGDYNFYLYCYDKSAQRVLAPKQAAVQQPPAHTKPKCKTNEKER